MFSASRTGASASSGGASGSRTVNVLPLPTPGLWALTVPPCISTRRLHERKTNAQTARLVGYLTRHLRKHVEHARELIRRDAHAVVVTETMASSTFATRGDVG